MTENIADAARNYATINVSERNICDMERARFLVRRAFLAGADWLLKQDAARGPRSVSGVGDAPGLKLNDWLEDVSGKVSEILELMRPKDNENGCPDEELSPIEQAFELFDQLGLDPHQIFSNYGRNEYAAYLIRRSEKKYDGEAKPDMLDDAVKETPGTFGGEFSRLVKEAYMKTPPIVAGFDPSRGDDFTTVFAFDVTRKATPLEEVSDELLDQLKEQIPVDVYVAEVSRRQSLKAAKDERDVLIVELQDKAASLENQLRFYKALAKARARALNVMYQELDSFEG